VIDAAVRFLRGLDIGTRVVSTQELPYGYARVAAHAMRA